MWIGLPVGVGVDTDVHLSLSLSLSVMFYDWREYGMSVLGATYKKNPEQMYWPLARKCCIAVWDRVCQDKSLFILTNQRFCWVGCKEMAVPDKPDSFCRDWRLGYGRRKELPFLHRSGTRGKELPVLRRSGTIISRRRTYLPNAAWQHDALYGYWQNSDFSLGPERFQLAISISRLLQNRDTMGLCGYEISVIPL